MIGLSWGYGLAIALWVISRWLWFDRLWWLGLINANAFFLFLPLPILLLLAIGQRQWRSLLGLSIPIITFGVLYGALFLPSVARCSANRELTLTVMSFNVLLENQNYRAIVQVIRQYDADVVGLQEVTPELATVLQQELSQVYPHHTLGLLNTGGAGATVLLSRFPITSLTSIPLPGQRLGFDLPSQKVIPLNGSRAAISATLEVVYRPVQVMVAHLVHNPAKSAPPHQWQTLYSRHFAERAIEVDRLRQTLKSFDQPFVLLCDCNFPDTSEAYRQISSFARDSFHEQGWGLGHTALFVSGVPLQRLDYVWHSDKFSTIEVRDGSDRDGSDHAPVITKLTLCR